jgi:hypothetical protein
MIPLISMPALIVYKIAPAASARQMELSRRAACMLVSPLAGIQPAVLPAAVTYPSPWERPERPRPLGEEEVGEGKGMGAFMVGGVLRGTGGVPKAVV